MNAATAFHDPFVPESGSIEPRPYHAAQDPWFAGSRRSLVVEAPANVDGPSEQQVKGALARILASSAFRHSARHRSFLRYIVLNTLAGQTRALKEVVIGLDVFERTLDRFDPRRDSIVRVEARRLRKKLRSYYEGEGRADGVEIRLDVGGYVPCFLSRMRTSPDRAVLPRVHVAPFVASDDSATRIVAAGLCDRLTDSLGAIDGVRVMAPFSPTPVRPLLHGSDGGTVPGGLDYVIDGSLIHLGSRWRCIVHLTSVPDGFRCWSETFDSGAAEEGGDPFALQDRVAAALSTAMRIELQRID